MKVYALASDQPVIKTFTRNNFGELQKTSYPNVYEFTSTEFEVTTIEELYQVIQATANAKACLLKGVLNKPLEAESRAGSTDRDTPTSWVCLDLDGVEGFKSVDDFLDKIGAANTDYVLQWSSGMDLDSNTGLRCHIFMLLRKPFPPTQLKSWLQKLNLTQDTLLPQLQLTKSGNALRYPLDITTCQNDKLLYVAPPAFGKTVKDPFPKGRISLCKRANRYFNFNPADLIATDGLRVMTDVAVNRLREAQGLPKRKPAKWKYRGTIEYMANPIAAKITGIKSERGYVYFNLNDGDSWGYYHPENKPEFIHNFKGEPVYRTEDLVPEYWAQLKAQSNGVVDMQDTIRVALCDQLTGKYWKAEYDKNADILNLWPAPSEKHIKDFLREHGLPVGDFVPNWKIVFNPHSTERVDVANRTLNRFSPSDLMKSVPAKVAKLPNTAAKVIRSALGDDPDTVEAFLNWLACIVQHRRRTQTAWILHGTQGTGKGVLFHQILTPIFSSRYCQSKRFDELDSSFVDFVEGTFITMIDEIQAGHDNFWQNKITAKLKNLIVEPYVNSREMYSPSKKVENFNNLIFTSNVNVPVDVPPDDRRFNVGVYQTKRLILTQQEHDVLLPQELPAVYGYLMHRPADLDKARTPHQNAAREQLISTNQLSADKVSRALRDGNLEFLWDQLPAKKNGTAAVNLGMGGIRTAAFRDLVVDAVTTGEDKLSREDLFTVFDYCVGGVPQQPHKFGQYLEHRGIATKAVWKDGRTVKGIQVKWKIDQKWLNNAKSEIQAGKV